MCGVVRLVDNDNNGCVLVFFFLTFAVFVICWFYWWFARDLRKSCFPVCQLEVIHFRQDDAMTRLREMVACNTIRESIYDCDGKCKLRKNLHLKYIRGGSARKWKKPFPLEPLFFFFFFQLIHSLKLVDPRYKLTDRSSIIQSINRSTIAGRGILTHCRSCTYTLSLIVPLVYLSELTNKLYCS